MGTNGSETYVVLKVLSLSFKLKCRDFIGLRLTIFVSLLELSSLTGSDSLVFPVESPL